MVDFTKGRFKRDNDDYFNYKYYLPFTRSIVIYSGVNYKGLTMENHIECFRKDPHNKFYSRYMHKSDDKQFNTATRR